MICYVTIYFSARKERKKSTYIQSGVPQNRMAPRLLGTLQDNGVSKAKKDKGRPPAPEPRSLTSHHHGGTGGHLPVHVGRHC